MRKTDIYTKEDIPAHLAHLFDTPIFKKSRKGAGFKKFTIKKLIFILGDTSTVRVSAIVIGNHCRKKTKHSLAFIFKDGKLIPTVKYLYTSILDYYLWMESDNALHKRFMKQSTQYKYELSKIKMKNPEFFL